jgi:hypothetical protein
MRIEIPAPLGFVNLSLIRGVCSVNRTDFIKLAGTTGVTATSAEQPMNAASQTTVQALRQCIVILGE